jgi:hypothetical protein
MSSLEIYFNDLTPDAQTRYLAAAGATSPDDLNHEICPIAILDFEGDPDNG